MVSPEALVFRRLLTVKQKRFCVIDYIHRRRILMKNILWAICLLQGISLSAQSVRDTLYLLNGSKIIGEIKGLNWG